MTNFFKAQTMLTIDCPECKRSITRQIFNRHWAHAHRNVSLYPPSINEWSRDETEPNIDPFEINDNPMQDPVAPNNDEESGDFNPNPFREIELDNEMIEEEIFENAGINC